MSNVKRKFNKNNMAYTPDDVLGCHRFVLLLDPEVGRSERFQPPARNKSLKRCLGRERELNKTLKMSI